MERLKAIKDSLVSCVESQMGHNLACVDSKELGEVVDMIKDMEEAIYYHSITDAMKESKEDEKAMEKVRRIMPVAERMSEPRYYQEPYYHMEPYRDMDREQGRMYYSGPSMNYARGQMNDSMEGGSRAYPMEIRDVREGKSPMSRKNYMEAKELRKGTPAQMQELESYAKDLTQDIVDMVKDASPEEKTMLQQKISALASKIK